MTAGNFDLSSFLSYLKNWVQTKKHKEIDKNSWLLTSIKIYVCPKINARVQALILFIVGKVENGLYIERRIIV